MEKKNGSLLLQYHTLKSGELDKTTDLILALADFDKDIKLTPNPKEYDL
ncbi:hypothetical protein [Cardinium endosymbiont of Philonthus spinipes]